MKLQVHTHEQARKVAKNLRTQLLAKANLKLPVGHSQEVLAGLLGVANWDTLCGMLKAVEDPTPPSKVAFEGTSTQTLVTLYVDAFACDEHGDGPMWARIDITQAFLQRLKQLQHAAQAVDAVEIRAYGGPEAWDAEDEIRYTNDELVVTRYGSFWMRAEVKHCDYHVETRGMDIEELHEKVAEALKTGQKYIFHAPAGLLENLKSYLSDTGELLGCEQCGAFFEGADDGANDACPSCASKTIA